MLDKKEYMEHTKIFEKNILNELEKGLEYLKDNIVNKSRSPNIYSCILDKDDTSFEYFLSPIIETSGEYIDRVYINKKYEDLIEIENKEFLGKFISNEEECRFKFVLERDKRYDEKINELYNAFLLSNLKWNCIDKRYMIRMYGIKIVEYIDEFIDFDKYIIDYNLDNDFIFNKNVFWNIKKENILSKKSFTRLDDIGYKYSFENIENVDILFSMDTREVEDIVYNEKSVDLYSKIKDKYIFSVFKIFNFDERLISEFTKSSEEKTRIVTLNHIKKEIEKYVSVEEISYNTYQKSYLQIPDYNPKTIKFTNNHIYIKIKNKYDEDNLFFAVNKLNLQSNNYEIRLYE